MGQISKRLQKALRAVENWSKDRQDAAADILEQMDSLDVTPYTLSDEERADVEEALAEVRRGELASDEEVAATFSGSACEAPVHSRGTGATSTDSRLF
jgi:hypothetical protein